MVLIVGQNSVWQNTYNLTLLTRGAVNRMTSVFASAAGKGSNVARALRFFGEESMLLAYVGGPNGNKFAAACEEDGIRCDFTAIERETRICTTLIEDSGVITEIVEPAPPISEPERRAFHESVARHIGESRLLVISGTAMTGETESCYLEFARDAHARGVPVVLDSYRDHGRRALEASPEVLKINADELSELSGRDCTTAAARRDAARSIRDRYSVRWVVITRGKEGAEAFDDQRSLEAIAPAVDLRNAIGSGDSFTAGVVAALLEGMPAEAGPPGGDFPWNANLERAIRLGTAMGTANCMNLKPGHILRSDYERVLGAVMVNDFSC